MRRLATYCAVLVALTCAREMQVNGASDVCFSPLGCFSMSAPWYSLFRPLPAPQPPADIDTRFYLYTRARVDAHHMVTRPHVSLAGGDFHAGRDTFFLTHGYTHDGNATWLRHMKDALLEKFDCNVIIVDWGRGSSNMNYFLVASNIRVVAAEVVRLARHLIEEEAADVSTWHMIGHSLGAHVFSYVGKAVSGIDRITALDPAQPGFEGYSQAVRLDASDAHFVDVIHTNARPFIPLGGFGMIGAVGHVDFYMNGGLDQPGCLTPSKRMFSVTDLYNGRVGELMKYVACPHERAYIYFTASIRDDNCTFWGRRLEDIATSRPCSKDSCSPVGLDAVDYPGRGSFHVQTNSLDPFCFPDRVSDTRMATFRVKRRLHKKTFRSLLDRWRSDVKSFVAATPMLRTVLDTPWRW